MLNIKNILYAICYLSIFLQVNVAHATGCEKEYTSLEMAYLRSDVIFSGYIEDNPEKGITEFRVTELFKDKLRGNNADIRELKYYNDGSGISGRFQKFFYGVEYIFYGKYAKENDKWLVYFSPCSKIKISFNERIKLLKSWS